MPHRPGLGRVCFCACVRIVRAHTRVCVCACAVSHSTTYEEAAQMQREVLEVQRRVLDPVLNIRPRELLGACPSAVHTAD